MDIILGLGLIVLIVFILRAFGAWMLRIDEVIDIQKEILKEIKKHNEDLNNTISTTKRINNFCKNCGAAIQPNETECAKCGVKS